MSVKSRKAEYAQATRAALVETARELFAERGYANTATEEIVRGARVTRGALYHHFHDKRDLFLAVFKEVERELVDTIVAAGAASGNVGTWERFLAGHHAYLDACLDKGVQRILLLDGPSVLGWETWRGIDAKYGLGLVRAGLNDAMSNGLLDRQPVEPLAHLILGALNEAALAMVRAEDIEKARAQVGQSVTRLLEGLRPRNR